MRIAVLLLMLAALLAHAADGPLSPEEALASFHLEPGLRAELVAAEPLTASPCALTWDERGRLFVAENRGYPTGGPEGKPLGVIALLEDTDGDGRMDKRTVFAEGFTFPNGLAPWRGGLIVTCAPDVLWLADTNGDGRADVRRVLLTGFSTNGSTQLRVSHPLLGPDGWIWLTCGLSGANLTSPQHPERPALKTSTDVRFHPDTLEVEPVDGRGQFGQTFDDYGRRFICMNRVQVQHVVLPSRYLKRNPNLGFTETVQNCPDLVPNPFLPGNNGAARIYPISANITTADSHAGTFTAACGVHSYRADALPGYRGRVFSCDPTGNLVHWDELIPVGATFSARRSTNQVEFLASTDNWFRPVFLATGPDGALYIADMYRRIIEHPEYLPVEVRKRTDFEGGKGMGRIWRVKRANPAATLIQNQGKLPAALETATGEELCRELGSGNGWRQSTAFRLLVERQDQSVVPFLRTQTIINANYWRPDTSALALRLLHHLRALDDATLRGALDREIDGYTDTALELAALRATNAPAVAERVLVWLRARGRKGLWAQIAAGQTPYEKKRERLLWAVENNCLEDRWQNAALLGSLAGQATPFLRDLCHAQDRLQFGIFTDNKMELLLNLGRLIVAEATPAERATVTGALADFARQCAQAERQMYEMVARGDGDGLFGITPDPHPQVEWELPVLQGITERLSAPLSLAALVSSGGAWDQFTGKPSAPKAPPGMDGILARSRRALTGPQPPAVQVAAARLLAEGGRKEDRARLLESFKPEAAAELQEAVVRGFVRLAGESAAPALLSRERWTTFTASMRERTLAALTERAESLSGVLDAAQAGVITSAELGPARRTQLLKHKDDAIRKRAEALFTQPAAGDRMKAYEQSKVALALAPNAANGREVFKRTCANCHRLDREGVAVGPDLFGIRNQPKETILLHIVVPEFEIAPNFASYTLETKDARTLSGLIVGETPASVTLRQALGVEETVLRSNITWLTAGQLSLMPQELEKTMTMQELADLLAYLKGEK